MLLDEVGDSLGCVDSRDDSLLNGEVVPVVLFAILDEVFTERNILGEQLAVLRVFVGDESASDVERSGSRDGVE